MAFADYWWNQTYTSAPRYYSSQWRTSNDCTNFLSQILYAGGVHEVDNNGPGDDYYNWWWSNPTHDPRYGNYTDSWPNAWHMIQHVYTRLGVNFSTTASWSGVHAGDFIAIDLVSGDGVTQATHTKFIATDGAPGAGMLID